MLETLSNAPAFRRRLPVDLLSRKIAESGSRIFGNCLQVGNYFVHAVDEQVQFSKEQPTFEWTRRRELIQSRHVGTDQSVSEPPASCSSPFGRGRVRVSSIAGR